MKIKLFHFLLDISDCVAYRCNFLSVLVRNFNIELLLKLHNHLYGVERISTEICLEVSFVSNLRLLYTQLISNNCFNFCFNSAMILKILALLFMCFY